MISVALLQYLFFFFMMKRTCLRSQQGLLCCPLFLCSVYGSYSPYFVMGRICITVNLLIDQNNILYLHEIICLEDENFLIGMCFGCGRFYFQYVPERHFTKTSFHWLGTLQAFEDRRTEYILNLCPIGRFELISVFNECHRRLTKITSFSNPMW